MTEAPLIDLRQVTPAHCLGGQAVPVFQDLDLAIPDGHFVAVMGPSGSGKSTLLNLLGGIDRPQRGEIRFRGRRIDSLGDGALTRWRAATIGFVFQFYNLLPVLTAAQNVELPLVLTRLSARQRRERVEAVLGLLHLTERKRHLPAQLSGGQRQRIGIARAIVADPKLLLCDEPTGDLDRAAADEVLDMLRFLNREQGKTVVMVTHDDLAARAARRVLRLDKGRFVTPEGRA
jgi:putative ABC transport system ATP-binding protein